MKRMMFACAAMAALQVAAITATKEYVDRVKSEIGVFMQTGSVAHAENAGTAAYSFNAGYADAASTAEDVSESTKSAVIAAAVQQAVAAGMKEDDVKAIVTNTVLTGGDWAVVSPTLPLAHIKQLVRVVFDGGVWTVVVKETWDDGATYGEMWYSAEGDDSRLTCSTPDGDLILEKRGGRLVNALGLARMSDLPDTSDFATKGELEDVADAQEGFLRDLAASSSRVDNLAGSVNVLWSHVYGNSVWIAVTNYLRTIEGVVPSFQLWEVRDGATNCVYSSAEEIANLTAKLIKDRVADAMNGMPSKAWSKYQSGSGAENPQPGAVTIVSTPNVMLTGGGEWYKCIETGDAAVWVLKSNGLCTFGGDTNGYFRIVDDEGKAQFEIVKTASFEVDAIASDTAFDASDNFTVTYNANMANPPTLYAAASLDDPFEGEDASHNINSLGISVAWAKNASGYWVATVHQDSRLPRLFVHAKVLQEGQNAIRNVAPMLLDGGLIIGGVKYTIVPYTTGGKTYLTLEAQ